MEYPFTSPIDTVPQVASAALEDVVIEQSNAITLAEGLALAHRVGVPLGRSTLQRWAKTWSETPGGPVKCVLLVTRTGRHYELDRDDLECWLQNELENQQTSAGSVRSPETSEGSVRSQQVWSGSAGPREASQDLGGFGEASSDFDETRVEELSGRIKELEDENMQLKIDVGVRRGLVSQAKEEIDKLRGSIEQVLKENGALEFQLRQLKAPDDRPSIDAPSYEAREVDNFGGESGAVL